MPSLFHRRTRSASAHQRPTTPSNSSAHMAAAQAFMANRVSTGGLSASAAATALRTMSPPPTHPGDVQTKRMQRRGSNASLGNAPRGRARGGLERSDSGGSMTERTFRSPSPGRPQQPAAQVEQPPPVPKLPANLVKAPPIPAKSSRRTASLDAGPGRLTSPPSKPGGRGQSAQPANPHSAAAAYLASRPPRMPELERSESRNSINFSYPRPQSPPMRSPASPEPQPNRLRNGISAAEAERVNYGMTKVSQQPVKKKKKAIAPQGAEGSHLSTGTMGSKPIVTPLEPGPAPQQQAQPVKKKKKQVAATGPASHFPPSPVSTQESDSDSTPEKTRRLQRASGLLNKQPSVVREDWEGEQEQYPTSQVQQLEQQGLSPASDAGRAVQGKKSMPAANMSRKMEEPVSPTPAPAEPAYTMATYHAVTSPHPDPLPAQPMQNKHLAIEESHQRVSSLSPSRSTRFSDRLASDLAAGQKHEPLPRSVSPAKSAMKHSPSGSTSADPSFPRLRGSSATPSDASDSNISADGSVTRKKSARVSFQPTVDVGSAAEKVDSDSPIVMSPQHKEAAKKGMFGRTKPTLATIPSQEDIDEGMKPRPQLPSFGSVRGKGRRTESSESVETGRTQQKAQLLPPANIASSASTSSDASSSSNNYAGGNQGTSNDHVVGSIFVQHAQRTSRNPSSPIPPEVTSVEGSGYVSDDDTDITIEDNRAANALMATQAQQVAQQEVVPTVAAPAAGPSAASTAVPALSLHPPTPGTEHENPTDQWALDVPGGFPSSADDLTRAPVPKPEAMAIGTGIAEPPTTPVAPVPQAKQAVDNEAETSDNDSIYSDAAEDIADLGDGFGSIDAVVESPIVGSPAQRIVSPPASPLADRPSGPGRTTSWEEAQQRWSGIAQQTRQATAVQPSQPVPTVSAPIPPAPVKKKKKKSAAAIAAQGAPTASYAAAESPPKAKNQGSAYPIVDSTNRAPPFRQSMRAQGTTSPTDVPHMRQSMRAASGGQPEHGFRSSMRGPPPAAIGAQRSRPKSMPQPLPPVAAAPPQPQRAALQKKHIPVAAAVPRQTPAPKPVAAKPALPPVNDDSDSESSFKKSRRKKAPNDGAYSMRSSMRAGASAAPAIAPTKPTRNGVRSLSPPIRRPFSPPPDKGFRSTMRGSMDTSAPSLRGQPEQKRSSSLFGRSRKTNSAIRQPLPLTAPIRSRLAESDEEDNTPQRTFKSRFNDSSDDEDEDALRPVRGIPRRHDDGDSTDLDDSSDDERKKKVQAPPKINTAVAAPPIEDRPLSPNTMKKKGLFSRFRSKKEKPEPIKPVSAAPVAKPVTKEDSDDEDGAGAGAGFENMGFGSAAERDAIIAQTMARLEAAKATEAKERPLSPVPQSPPESPAIERPPPVTTPSVSGSVSGSPAQGSPAAGRLQRRITPQRFASDSWPLPPKIGTFDDEQRPSTSDAVPQTNGSPLRPGVGQRVPTSETLRTVGGTPVLGRTGKKKRFPLLRKAFGLRD